MRCEGGVSDLALSNGSLVQPGRTAVSKAACRWFESIRGRQKNNCGLQFWRTDWSHKPVENGSIPLPATNLVRIKNMGGAPDIGL